MIQAGAKASNVEFLKALEKKWTMSSPEHLGPLDRHEKLKFIGVMISRQPHKTNDKVHQCITALGTPLENQNPRT
eukprot:3984942-Prorocentrum_lima.AAC.1